MSSKPFDPYHPHTPPTRPSRLGALVAQPSPTSQVSRLPVLLSRYTPSTTITRSFTPDYTSLGEHLGHDPNFRHNTISELVNHLAESSLIEGKYFEQHDILSLKGGDVIIQRLKEWDSELGYIIRSTCEWRHIESTERDSINSWDWQEHWAEQEAEGSYYNVRDYAFVKIEEGMEYAVTVFKSIVTSTQFARNIQVPFELNRPLEEFLVYLDRTGFLRRVRGRLSRWAMYVTYQNELFEERNEALQTIQQIREEVEALQKSSRELRDFALWLAQEVKKLNLESERYKAKLKIIGTPKREKVFSPPQRSISSSMFAIANSRTRMPPVPALGQISTIKYVP